MPANIVAPPDITRTSEIELVPGGWYALEFDKGRSFRWVDNAASFVLPAALNPFAEVELELGAGPGMGRQFFELTVRGETVDQVFAVRDHQLITLSLPLSRHRRSRFTLHADGGGLPCPNDDRQLNFRVFRLAMPPSIVNIQSGVELLSGWEPMTSVGGPPARVAQSGTQMRVHAHRDFPVLCLDVDPGRCPSPAGLRIDILDERDAPVFTTAIQGRQLVGARLPLRSGASKVFSLYLEWIGSPSAPAPALVAFFLRLN